MALHDNDFIDESDEADAGRAPRTIPLIGVLVAFVLGFSLVSLLLYGRILTDDAAVVSSPPAAITAPVAPTTTPTAPTSNAP